MCTTELNLQVLPVLKLMEVVYVWLWALLLVGLLFLTMVHMPMLHAAS